MALLASLAAPWTITYGRHPGVVPQVLTAQMVWVVAVAAAEVAQVVAVHWRSTVVLAVAVALGAAVALQALLANQEGRPLRSRWRGRP